ADNRLLRIVDVHQTAAVAQKFILVRESFRPLVAPVVQENVVLVTLVRVEKAIGASRTDDDAVLDGPGLRRIGVLRFGIEKSFPAAEVPAVKEVGKALTF